MGKIEDDPTYNQPNPTNQSSSAGPKRVPVDGEDSDYPSPASTSDDSYSHKAYDDPTYNQPKRVAPGAEDSDYSPRPTQPTGRQDGSGSITEDPTYDRPRPSSTDSYSISGSPTYSQTTSIPAGGGDDADHPPPMRIVSEADRPSYSISDDPTYNQPASIPTDSSDDPVYSQRVQSRATSRLSQLTSQISPPASEPNTSKPRRKTKKTKNHQSALPSDYSDILNTISRMQHHAHNPPPNDRGYTRQIRDGKLTSRQRIATLLNPGSFRELGSVTGKTTWSLDPNNPLSETVKDFTPSNNPQGFGQITCLKTGNMPPQTRQVYLTSDDFAIRGGHADGHNGLKTLYGEKLVLRLKVPAVKLVDGSSGGGSVTTIATTGYSYLPHVTVLKTVVQQLNAGIPNIGAVVGPAIGLGAARVVSTHFSVMAADIGSLFNAGPKVVEGATFEEGLSFQDLGGPWVHCCNGTIDNMAANEKECYEQIRTVLGYLPDCGNLQAPPCFPADWSGDDVNREDERLRSIVPRKKNRMYNPYTIIESVVDRGSWFEIGRLWGRTGIVGLARLGGKPVAILSNNCEVNGGALDALGSQKLLKHIKFADVFNLPIVQFVDVPGYAIGTVAEKTGVMKWGVELGKAYYTSTTPIFTVLTRRAYGVAGGIMLDSREPWMRVSWPSANWGSLPLDGGIEVGHRHELKVLREKAEEEKPGSGEEAFKKRYKELDEMYVRLMNPVRTANVFNIEEIVDPKDTRKICCRWAKEMYGVVMQERLADRAARRIVPVFS